MTLAETILSHIRARNWEGLSHLLLSMSNSEYRKAEVTVREKVMTQLPNQLFWEAYLHLLIIRRQSFVTCILSAHHLALHHQLDFNCKEAIELSKWLKANSPETAEKIVKMAVPIMQNIEQLENLFQLFNYNDEQKVAAILVKETTPHAYYVLFNVMRHGADNQKLLHSVCLAMMKKNDDLSFNMASLIRSYFDLNDIKSTFSLQIEPYELSYIEQSFDTFLHVLKGKRPRL